MLSEISQSQKEKYHMISLICGRNKTDEHMGKKKKRKKEREANHKRLLTIENKLRVAGGEVGRGMD